MDSTTAVWYAAGLLVLLLLVQLLAKPLEITARILGNSLMGGLAIWVVNLVGVHVGFQIGLNPVSAVIVGMLGLPGLISLGAVRIILG
jgi:inhibitor of the pro-sigma K processing machinery